MTPAVWGRSPDFAAGFMERTPRASRHCSACNEINGIYRRLQNLGVTDIVIAHVAVVNFPVRFDASFWRNRIGGRMGKTPGFEPLIESIHDAAGAPGLSPGVTAAPADLTGFFGACRFIEEAALAHGGNQRGERS